MTVVRSGAAIPVPQRWLVLPGLACPASSFDQVRSELRQLGAPVVLDVLDAWVDSFLEDDPRDLLAGRSYAGVVGHSLGGLLALEMSLRRDGPPSADQFLLLDPTTPDEVGPAPLVRRLLETLVPRALRWAGSVGLVRGVGSLVDRWWQLDPVTGTPSFTKTAVWQRVWRENMAGWDRAQRVGRELTARAAPRLPVTHLVAGRARHSDRRAQVALSQRLGTQMLPVPGSGHLVMRDRPDIVATVIAQLSSSPGAVAVLNN